MHVAEDVRRWMASLGVRTFDELVGQVELLERDPAVPGGKAGADRPLRGAAGARRSPPTRRAARSNRARARRTRSTTR